MPISNRNRSMRFRDDDRFNDDDRYGDEMRSSGYGSEAFDRDNERYSSRSGRYDYDRYEDRMRYPARSSRSYSPYEDEDRYMTSGRYGSVNDAGFDEDTPYRRRDEQGRAGNPYYSYRPRSYDYDPYEDRGYQAERTGGYRSEGRFGTEGSYGQQRHAGRPYDDERYGRSGGAGYGGGRYGREEYAPYARMEEGYGSRSRYAYPRTEEGYFANDERGYGRGYREEDEETPRSSMPGRGGSLRPRSEGRLTNPQDEDDTSSMRARGRSRSQSGRMASNDETAASARASSGARSTGTETESDSDEASASRNVISAQSGKKKSASSKENDE